MNFELLTKSGYKVDFKDDKIVITSNRKLTEFLTTTLVTLVLIYMVTHAKLNDNLFMKATQLLIFSILVVGPFFLLVVQWRHRIVIQKGCIQTPRIFKGSLYNNRIINIDIKIQQSFINKDVTISIHDLDNGANKVFVVSVKKKDLAQVNDLVNQIGEYVGLEKQGSGNR